MSYIRDMTAVLLDEIDLAETMLKHSEDIAYGYWFAGRARSMVEQVETDFHYYIEVTEITKKAMTDRVARSVYDNLTYRIERLKSWDKFGINLG